MPAKNPLVPRPGELFNPREFQLILTAAIETLQTQKGKEAVTRRSQATATELAALTSRLDEVSRLSFTRTQDGQEHAKDPELALPYCPACRFKHGPTFEGPCNLPVYYSYLNRNRRDYHSFQDLQRLLFTVYGDEPEAIMTDVLHAWVAEFSITLVA